MLDSMSRKVVHELTGTRRGVAISLKIKASASLNVEPILDNLEKFAKNQIDAAVPKNQEQLDIEGGTSDGKAKPPGKRRIRKGVSGKDKAAGAAAE